MIKSGLTPFLVDEFTTEHDFGTPTASTNSVYSYQFTATPKPGVTKPYESVSCEVDFRGGVVTTFDFWADGEVALSVRQSSPQEITSGIWFHSLQSENIPVHTNWDMRKDEELQMGTIQINTDALPDTLFDF